MSTDHDYFDSLDLLKDYRDRIPEFEAQLIQGLINRNTHLLQRRSIKAINNAAFHLDWMLMASLDYVDNECSPDKFYAIADTLKLLYVMPFTGLGDSPGFTDGTWPEYFAILSLKRIQQGLKTLPPASADTITMAQFMEAQQRIEQQTTLSPFLMEASYALTLAEQLNHQPNLIEHHIKQFASQGGSKKNAKTNQLKAEFIQYCLKHDSQPSIKQLAQRFYDGLPEPRKRLLTPTNAIRTLCDAMTDYNKERLSKHVLAYLT